MTETSRSALLVFALAGVFSALSLVPVQVPPPPSTPSRETARPVPSEWSILDTEFAQRLALSIARQRDIARYASTHARSAEVQELASALHKEHLADETRVRDLAGAAGITLRWSDPGVFQQRQLRALMKVSDEAFDKLFIGLVVENVESDISDCQREIERGRDADVRSLASSMLPALQGRFDRAWYLREEMRAEPAEVGAPNPGVREEDPELPR